ncbi:M48 family metalloprotease [Pontibacter chitinilyticus]|uniref:M48 family metalloprotease n=1 Tax=Pontibacter chitinilyticus TaxID=2674989 RepID=UPI00321B9CCE
MKHPFRFPLWLVALLLIGALNSCKENEGVIFSPQDDIKLGEQLAHEVDATYRAKGQLLDHNSSNVAVQQAYASLDRIVNRILNSGEVKYRNDFPWTVTLLKDDGNLNAFATPGGHLYVFSGLLKSVAAEDRLAGVLAHMIAHADRRHSVQQLQREYGIAILLSVALGNDPGTGKQIAAQLEGTMAGLQFSPTAETEAHTYARQYLKGTNYYDYDATAGFFVHANKETQPDTSPGSLQPAPESHVKEKKPAAIKVAPDADLTALKTALNNL